MLALENTSLFEVPPTTAAPLSRQSGNDGAPDNKGSGPAAAGKRRLVKPVRTPGGLMRRRHIEALLLLDPYGSHAQPRPSQVNDFADT